MGKWVGLALVFAAGLVIAAVAGAADTKLTGVVGPGFTISLVDAQGQSVTRLPAGEVDITVDDRGNEHNFHLRGPGVDFSTGVEEVGQRTFTVTLRDGNYTFVCDPHAGQMAGAFQAGTGGTTTPPPTTSPPPTTTTPSPTRPAASAPVGSTLNLTVGPGFTISLRTRAGKKVTVLRPGSYTVVARDRSSAHNARLRGAGRVEGHRRRVRRDEDVARHAPERPARHPVRPAQDEHAGHRPRRLATRRRQATRRGPRTRRLRPRQRAPSGVCPAAGGDQAAGFGSCRIPLGEQCQSTLPPTYQTAPWVATWSTSESRRRTVARAGIPSASRRSKQRRAIAGETP